MSFDLQTNELEHKFLKERIISVDKNIAEVSSKLSAYVKKLACLRDAGDEVSKSIQKFSSKERYNQTLRLSLGEFSDLLKSIQEYRDAQINRTQNTIIPKLDAYNPICKLAKVDIKKCFDARAKELKKKAELEKIRSKTCPNWQKIAQAEIEVITAQNEAAQATEALSKLVENFEKKKLESLKNSFLDFVKIEMIFHAKAIEHYTKSYNVLTGINVDEDLHEFKSTFKGLNQTKNLTDVSPHIDVSLQTIPKVIDKNPNDSPHVQPKTVKGIQGKQRSIFTLKTKTERTSIQLPDFQNPESSLENTKISDGSHAIE